LLTIANPSFQNAMAIDGPGSNFGGALSQNLTLEAPETEMTAARITQINRSLGGTTTLTGDAETVIANMAYREGAVDKAATAIRDIAGRHLFDDANKRTAQAVAEQLLGSGANSAQVRTVIDQVATGQLRTVEQISAALKPGG
jgi:prophage maintenance system killer protein